jgi:hypothetical protein
MEQYKEVFSSFSEVVNIAAIWSCASSAASGKVAAQKEAPSAYVAAFCTPHCARQWPCLFGLKGAGVR